MRGALGLGVVVVVSVASTALAQSGDPGEALLEIRQHILYARYQAGEQAARELLERDDLTAAQRNGALEALAIAQIARRRTDDARETLQVLFARDPEHRLTDPDVGPDVIAVFGAARDHAEPRSFVVLADETPPPAPGQSPLIVLRIAEGADAVGEVRLAYRTSDDGRLGYAVMVPSADRSVRAQLPVTSTEARSVEWFAEARAPSGTVIGRLGTDGDPRTLPLPSGDRPLTPLGPGPTEPGLDEGSSLGPWWLWAAIGVVIAGGAIAAVLLLGPDDPRPTTLGTIQLER